MNSNVKHSAPSDGMQSREMYGMSAHDIGACSLGVRCVNMHRVGMNGDFSSAIKNNYYLMPILF
jgi:hypothetical protein